MFHSRQFGVVPCDDQVPVAKAVRPRLWCALVTACLLTTGLALQAQTYHVIFNFDGGPNGASPFTGLTIDTGGNLYGTAFSGGSAGFGVIFTLDSDGSGWMVAPLYTFHGGNDGAGPVSRLAIGPNGAFYGTTSAGGGGPCNDHNGYRGCGTVFQVQPPPRTPRSVIYSWNSNVLHRFSGTDGAYPQGDLIFDASGNIYGTTVNGGSAGWGSVYSLTHSGGGWTETSLYQPQGDGDGAYPWGGLVFDGAGNLYGTFSQNGPGGFGAIFKLARSGSSWTESTVHGFTYHGNDGAAPQGGLILNASGDLFGTTVHDTTGGGSVFELTPSGGSWSYDFLYSLSGGIDLGPYDKLVMDSSGNLYGTTFGDGQYGLGSVFKLTRSSGGWTYRSLHDFTGGSDGANPMCALVFDSNGNLYGTASGGGAHHDGVIFQITP